MKWQSPKLGHYIQPESFERGEISIIMNPFKKPMTSNYNISTIKETFEATPTQPIKHLKTDPAKAGPLK